MSAKNEDAGVLDTMRDWLDGELENGEEGTKQFSGMRSGWLHLLVHTNNSYREKLALLLFSIWTTSSANLSSSARDFMWEYIEKIRTAAYNPDLKALALDLSRTPMMLYYLHGNSNVKDGVNEAYARALFEHFMLGPSNASGEANYNDNDVTRAAEALTGWQVVELEDSQGEMVLRPFFISADHVQGGKNLFDGAAYACTVDNDAELLNCLFDNHPGVATFYATKLLQFYVTPTPSAGLVQALADEIQSSGFNLDQALKKLFMSVVFYSSTYQDTVPKNPIEVALEWIRTLGLPVNIGSWSGLRYQIDRMGMSLTDAPSPAWYPERRWSTLPQLTSVANLYASLLGNTELQTEKEWSAAQALPKGEIFATEVVEYVAKKLGIPLSANQTEQLKYYMNYTVNWEGEQERELYDNLLEEHQRRKGLGLYSLLGLSAPFLMK